MSESDHATDQERIMQRVLEKAQSDPAFRSELMTNPKAVLEREFGIDLPDDAEIRVVEEGPNQLHIILPAETDELSDGDLDAVAGGLGMTRARMPRFPSARMS